MANITGVSASGTATDETARERVQEAARAHDRLDSYGIPRFARGHWFPLDERITMLVDRCTQGPAYTPDGPSLVPGPAENGWTPSKDPAEIRA